MSNLSILANSFHGLRIIMIQNLRGNQHISILAAFVFGSAILDMRINWFDLIFNDDFYLPLFFYFILWKGHTWANLRRNSPFLFIKHKRILISSEGFSTLEKKTPWYVIRGNADMHPVGCYRPLQIVVAVWRSFCLNSSFLGRVWQPSADNADYLQRVVSPDLGTQQNSL